MRLFDMHRPVNLPHHVLILILLALPVNAATIYCSPAGGGSGADFNNLATLPNTTGFTRGNTYILIEGNYGSKTLSEPVSGSTFVRIRKTSAADNAVAGYASSLHDGQVVFNAPLVIDTGFWAIDGMERNVSDWFDTNAYGIKIAHNGSQAQMEIGLLVPAMRDVYITNVWLQGEVGNLPGTTERIYAIDTDTLDTHFNSNFVFSAVLVTGSNNPFFFRKTKGTILEYSATDNPQCNAANHAVVVNLYFSSDNAIIRYNNFRRSFTEGGVGGTALVGTAETEGVQIYGNIFDRFTTADAAIGFNGLTGQRNNKVYNNLFIDGDGTGAGCHFGTDGGNTGNAATNNIWINCSPVTHSQCTHNFNAYSGAVGEGEANQQLNMVNTIFESYANKDFRLKTNTTAGATTPYANDMVGTAFNVSGTWSRGAFAFVEEGGGEGVAGAIATAIPGAGQVRGRRFSP